MRNETGDSTMQLAGAAANISLPPELTFGTTEYAHMDVSLDPTQRTLWAWFKAGNAPHYSKALLDDMSSVASAAALLGRRLPRSEQPIDYIVTGSRIPDVYNLGGDLALFADCIRRRDAETLRAYAHTCASMTWSVYNAFNMPSIVICLAQGSALGGGFEAALACNLIVAEKRARFGLPEILFNMFPGMGAYSLLSRRVGAVKAEEMIHSGRIYTAEEMQALGLVEVLAEDGEGEEAVRTYIARNRKRHETMLALHDVRRRVGGLTLSELIDVTDRWVELAMTLDEGSLRRMERLRGAQSRRSAA
jgi:DSF synthase